MPAASFIKMHGSGNDFVVIDARARPLAIGPAAARSIADRRKGVGCDQLIVLGPAANGRAHATMRIFNADGSEVAACGNATRCVGALLLAETGADVVRIETAAGLLAAEPAPDGGIRVDLGPVRTFWQDIPLAKPCDTLHLGIRIGALADPVAVSVGNPHAVFLVDDADAVPLAELGPRIERHPLFPEATNVEVVGVLAPDRLRVRVWERGCGITPSCGTGAAAAAVAAHRRGLAGRSVSVVMDGGPLAVSWRDDGHVLLAGPVAVSFRGTLDPALLADGGVS